MPGLEVVCFAKAACTTVGKWFASVVCAKDASLETSRVQNAEKLQRQRPHPERMVRPDADRNWLFSEMRRERSEHGPAALMRIFVVREPFRRFVSAFINKFVRYQSTPLRCKADLEFFAADVIDWLASQREDATFEPSDGPSLRQLLRFAEAHPQDLHFGAQSVNNNGNNDLLEPVCHIIRMVVQLNETKSYKLLVRFKTQKTFCWARNKKPK